MRKQKGFNLVELLIAMVVGLLALSGVVYVFVGNSEHSIYHLKATRFSQQMADAMARMVMDLRRSGYMGYEFSIAGDSPPNPYMVPGSTEVTLSKFDASDPYNTCLTYSYNRKDVGETDPVVGVGSSGIGSIIDGGVAIAATNTDQEIFGFRYANDAVEMRRGLVSGTTLSQLISCSTGSWQGITDTEVVEIDGLKFEETVHCTQLTASGIVTSLNPCTGSPVPAGSVESRMVTITLSGHSVQDSDLTQVLEQTIKLPNDKLF